MKMKVTCPSLCPFRVSLLENDLHLFMYCTYARKIWKRIAFDPQSLLINASTMYEVLSNLIQFQATHPDLSLELFAIFTWQIWNA